MIKCKMSQLSRSVYVETVKKGAEQDRPSWAISNELLDKHHFFPLPVDFLVHVWFMLRTFFLFNFDKNNFWFQSINATVFHRQSETNCHPQIPASWHGLISSRQSHFCHPNLQTDFCFPIKGNVMKTSDDNLFVRPPPRPTPRDCCELFAHDFL